MATTGAGAALAAAASINQEQLLHELEQKHLKLKADFVVLESERDAIVQQKNASAAEIQQLQATIAERDVAALKASEELLQLRTERDQLAFQTKTVSALAERRLTEIEDLQTTVKDQSKQLVEAQRKEVEALQRAAEHETQVEPLRHSVQRLNKEMETQKQHVEWMEKQLTEKTKIIQELRESLSKNAHDGEESKLQHEEEAASLRRQLESARQVSKKLESSLVQTKEQVKEVQAAKVHDEDRFQNELNAQRRLAELYKDSADDANARVAELQELCDSLRRSLAESNDALNHEAERTSERVEHLFREQADAAEQRIAALQEELKEAHQRIEEMQKKKMFTLQEGSTVAELSSAAAEAHLASQGLTPKKMYDHIVELENSLREERDEKEKLQIYMDRIVKEVHEKAPMIMSLKLEHERAVASHSQVSERLEACMQELTKYRSRERQAWSEKQSYEKKCESLAKSVDDLSRQVQHLLFRSHEQRLETGHSQAVTGEVVSENLVVFKDVEELQMRNQQLLMVIRELTEAKKSKAAGDSNGATHAHLIVSADSDNESDDSDSSSGISKRLAVAQKEIEELRSEREEERQMIAAIVKQRDMYRVLLAQADSQFTEGSSRSFSQDDASVDGHHRHSSADISDPRAVRELQKEFDSYRKEKQTNMKMLQESLDQARGELSQARLAQMQADVESKCNKDRFEAAEKRRLDSEEEIIRLRTKMDQVNAMLIQHQKLLADSEAKLDTATTRVRTLDIELQGANREIEFLKKQEDKTLQELSTLRLDNTNLLKLMDSNRQIEASREEREHRESERLAKKVMTLENKLQETFDKLESSDALASAKLSEAEQSKKIAVMELDQLKSTHASAREQIARLEEQRDSLTSKSTLLEKEVTHLRDQLRKGAPAAAAERVATLELQVREAQREVQSALEMKKSLTDAISKYKAIAEANEKSFEDLSNASQKWKTMQEEKLKAMAKEKSVVQEEVEKLRGQMMDHVTEGNKLREDMDRLEQTHQQALRQAQEQHQRIQLEADSARLELSALREETMLLRKDLSGAQENYERELKLHASEVEKFASSRKLIEDEQRKNLDLMTRVAELNAKNAAAERESVDKISTLEKLLTEATEAKNALTEQNKLLHTQLERASHQLRRAHEQALMKVVENPGGATESGGAVAHNTELDDLRSVITFLRKESEISTSKLELANQENQRLRAQVTSLEATIARLREDLKQLEGASARLGSSSADYGLLSDETKRSAQLEQLSLLRESNATLRDECQKNLARFKAEEERAKALEGQLAPLQTSESRLTAEVASLKQELAALTEANKRWKSRVEQLVEKYQQVDPAEHEKVCAEKDALAKELADLQTKEAALRTEVDSLKSNEGKSLEEEKTKAENLRKQYDRIKGFAKTWKTKAETLTKQVAEKTKEAEDKAALVTELQRKIIQADVDKSTLQSKITTLEAAKAESGGATAAASATWEKERQDLTVRVDIETKKVTQLKEMNSKLLTGMKALKQENTQLKGQLSTATSEAQADSAPAVTSPPTSSPPLPVEPAPPSNSTSTTSPGSVVAPPLPTSSPPVVPPVPAATTSVSATPPTTTTAAPVKSPVRAPVSAPSVVPTLKAVTGAPPTQNAAPATAAAAPTKPATAPVKPPQPAVTAPVKPQQATVAAPVKPPQVAVVASSKPPQITSAAPLPVKSENAPAASVSDEEKLRLSALQSLKKQFLKAGGDASKQSSSVSQGTTPVKPLFGGVAKPPLPGAAPTSTEAEKKTADEGQDKATSSSPFLTLAPTGGAFAAFGSGGASGLVFGKPGITLPVPSSPTPTIALGGVGAAASSTTTAAPTQAEAGDVQPPAGGEAVRRSQRLARFGVPVAPPTAGAVAPATVTTLKRPAPATAESETPLKMAKTGESDSSAPAAVQSTETEGDQATTDDSTQPTQTE
ncbi:hypothetical protein Poli38472_013697 [Pythium oligandrum]|uniref:Nucleoprotein TPR/MLP1 domain-containing protein n=1 Tax=Pythium oligandrum TaxID=41045 RepID=A0A8K1CDU5_PYTOL|nr:hypothetical protein Poli38472_013697 [Pythium oligandrum]|eukprot:TMW61234.1 hypothetical protein Poli38472_013697 [Pythium oligandrum]